MAKINISINDELLKKIDDYADEIYTSRSGLIGIATAEYMNQKEVMKLVRQMSIAIGKVAETGTVDKETLEAMEDFERFANMFYPQRQ